MYVLSVCVLWVYMFIHGCSGIHCITNSVALVVYLTMLLLRNNAYTHPLTHPHKYQYRE